MQKKLLFIGVDTSTHDAVRIAKELDIYTIITDYNTPEAKPEKAEADAYWMIDAADTDAIYKRCLNEHIDGIFAGNNEFCLDKAKELCGRLRLPFYASDNGWRCARDKIYFKELCAECGLDTPKAFMTEGSLDDIDTESITFPVMVKPSDSCARQGISICRSATELPAAYEYALSASHNGRIIIEEYIRGEELAADFMVVDGKPYLTNFNTILTQEINGEKLLTLSLQSSRHYDDFCGKCKDNIARFVQLLDWRTGPCFLQAIVRDGRYYFLEFGGRLTGIGAWAPEEYFYGMSKLRMSVMFAAGMRVNAGDAVRISSDTHCSLIYMPWLKPGTIRTISGIDEIKHMPGAEFILNRYKPGDIIQSSGSMFNIACYLAIAADSEEKLLDNFAKVNDTLSFISTDDEEMLIRYTDTECILREYR